MGNPRWPVGFSLLLTALILGGGRGCLYSFMHRSAFTLDLGEGIYELTLLKGDILHYCQGLIDSLQEHAKLVTASFHT